MYRLFFLLTCFFCLGALVYMGFYSPEDVVTTEQVSAPLHTSEPIEPGVKQAVANRVTESSSLVIEPLQGSILLRLRQLLQQRNFSELNSILDDYQKTAELDITAEDTVFTAYESFSLEDRSYEKLLGAWIEETPSAYQPYVARAKYYYSMGWVARGTKWASETKESQFVKMDQYFDKSMQDIAQALSINAQSMVPYTILMGIFKAQGKADATARAARKALDVNPISYKVRANYLLSITPRWGGSFELMQVFIDESLRHVSSNPKLKLLEGFIYADAAHSQVSLKKYNTADELFSKALSYGDNHAILMKRGENNHRRGSDHEALKDMNRAIEMYPEEGDYYLWRSMVYSKFYRYDEALKDIKMAYRLNPFDKDIKQQHKWLSAGLADQKKLQSEKQNSSDIQGNTSSSGPTDQDEATSYFMTAKAAIDQGKYRSAKSNLRKAIELSPDNFEFYMLFDWLLFQRKDWGQIVESWDKYISRNPNDDRAYAERSGAYFHKGDVVAALNDAKIAADMGNARAKEFYERYKHLVK